MRKIVIEKPGSYNRLQIREFPDPKPGPGEILIKIKACGVNFADCLIRMGVYSSAKEYVGWPITPGFEAAGIVAEVGQGVTRFQPGQRVIAITRFGGYSTHLVLPEDQVFLLPDSLDFIQGAAFPAVFLTAYYALFELVHPRKNDTLLIHSAAGGVGSALVQLGKLAGCHVVGVVGASHKVDFVKSFGVTSVIDKSSQNLWKEAERLAPMGYEVILDANGIETLRQSYDHLSLKGGKLVVYGFHTMFSKGRGTPNWAKMIWDYFWTPRFNPMMMTMQNRSVLAFNLSYLFEKKDFLQEGMNLLLQWFAEGKVMPPKVKAFPFEEVAKAHRELESGQTIGKIALEID